MYGALLGVVSLAQCVGHELAALLDHGSVMLGIHEAAGYDVRRAD